VTYNADPRGIVTRRRCLLLAVASTLMASGCSSVSRRMTIRSEPSGALVQVDGQRLGTTPKSMDFTYYGTREVQLSMPGYETLTVEQPVRPPLYQIFPFDFFTDNFLPFRVTNRHDFVYRLQPRARELDEEQPLLDRARGFRSQAQVGS
jgi:PEGA domain